jgi:hypothetical protein
MCAVITFVIRDADAVGMPAQNGGGPLQDIVGRGQTLATVVSKSDAIALALNHEV